MSVSHDNFSKSSLLLTIVMAIEEIYSELVQVCKEISKSLADELIGGLLIFILW